MPREILPEFRWHHAKNCQNCIDALGNYSAIFKKGYRRAFRNELHTITRLLDLFEKNFVWSNKVQRPER